jgi:hypothetical protein
MPGNEWIKGEDLIDTQIVRKRTSLRMVYSRKIGGSPLLFDDNKYIMQDSLIRIFYDIPKYTKLINTSTDLVIKNKIKNIKISNICVEPTYPKNIYKEVFKICDKKMPGIFTMGKISGNILSLLRKKSSKCLLSNKKHDNENAFCIINYDFEFEMFEIYFGCYRKCNKTKSSLYIGTYVEDI